MNGERCPWCEGSELYRHYHDTEWGVPLKDERALFELLLLEGAQAGLSWATILKKRENYRRAFDGFDPAKIAAYDEAKVAALLADSGIVRNRAKVAAAVGNACACLALHAGGGSLADFLWQFVDGEPIVNHWTHLAEVPARTTQSDAMSKALQKAGFKFVGSTICYALMQSAGLVNDHLTSCPRHAEIAAGLA
ncbi:MAG: DNA-3-methyladenine glycosylase I [Azonexus sp.]|jgi:DNA-3-methyladenine glycosylase I|uniref:DNA-3-methyladenine glycosylase I n=1 Tax=Azonexus sp. TaxID=1872668 RepID=UPI00283851FA|nr:DNA-3-methyladenine glycosylase I [Azonexus sp.]MDR0775029.1 DNA-3-methyladenine glycosylase I [Azonexus sp.]